MFSLPNILTACNLLCGVLGIIFALSGRIDMTPWLVVGALIFDFFDGFLARLLHQKSEIGKQLDSLADMVSFGVLPGIVCFILLIIGGANEICTQQQMSTGAIWVNESFGASIRSLLDFYLGDLTGNPIATAPFHFTAWYLFIPFIALLIPFMSIFRLAKFNLDTRQTEEFIGLPTPANTLFFISFPLMLWDAWGETNLQNKLSMLLIQDQILVTFIVFFSFLLVAEFPMISFKFKHYKWIENQYRYALIFCSIVLIVLFSFWSLPIILFLYIILSLIKNSQKKKTKVNL